MEPKEFLEKLGALVGDYEKICYTLEKWGDLSPELKEQLEAEFGVWELVDDHGGEGEGNDYWQVLHFPKIGLYLKLDGWYASYEGHSWDGVKVVEPKQKTITVYEQV